MEVTKGIQNPDVCPWIQFAWISQYMIELKLNIKTIWRKDPVTLWTTEITSGPRGKNQCWVVPSMKEDTHQLSTWVYIHLPSGFQIFQITRFGI